MKLTLLLVLVSLPQQNHAFIFTRRSPYISLSVSISTPASRSRRRRPFFSVDPKIENDELLQSIRSLRVKEIKNELESLNISTANALEKEELVQRLFRARTNGAVGGGAKTTKKKKRRTYDNGGPSLDEPVGDTPNSFRTISESSGKSTASSSSQTHSSLTETNSFGIKNDATITVPIQYFTLDSSKQIQDRNSEDIYIRPAPSKYAAIKIKLQSKLTSASVEYTLLVDTACSGIVLSPEAVSRSYGVVNTVRGAASMTTAGGVGQGGYDVATWGDKSTMKFIVGGMDVYEIDGINSSIMNMAAVNDIGALPGGLDGILGLSFLNKFACVDFDFANGELRLYKTIPSPSIRNNEAMSIVAEGSLDMTKLGIYTVDTMLDGRGPVKLLIDTGAASTFLNWKGVSDLGLSSASPQIELIRDTIGAMGADNTALRLTHRYVLKRRWNINNNDTGGGNYSPGVGIRGTDFDSGMNIDIGDLPVLDALNSDGAGGILGADLLMMCDVVMFFGLDGASPNVKMMKK